MKIKDDGLVTIQIPRNKLKTLRLILFIFNEGIQAFEEIEETVLAVYPEMGEFDRKTLTRFSCYVFEKIERELKKLGIKFN